MSEDAGIEPRTVATLALPARRSNHLARSHPLLARSHPHLARSHPHLAREISSTTWLDLIHISSAEQLITYRQANFAKLTFALPPPHPTPHHIPTSPSTPLIGGIPHTPTMSIKLQWSEIIGWYPLIFRLEPWGGMEGGGEGGVGLAL